MARDIGKMYEVEPERVTESPPIPNDMELVFEEYNVRSHLVNSPGTVYAYHRFHQKGTVVKTNCINTAASAYFHSNQDVYCCINGEWRRWHPAKQERWMLVSQYAVPKMFRVQAIIFD